MQFFKLERKMNTKKRACNFTRSYTVIPQLCISPDASSTAFHNLIRDCNDFIAFLTYKMTNNFRAQFLIFQRKIYDIKANAKRKKQEERYDIIINEVYTMTKSKHKVYRLNDFFFKNLMGDEKRSNLTLRFLNLILNRTEENAFKSIQFLKTEQDPLTKDGKLSILDVKASVDDKTFVNIELQVSRQNYIIKRSMFYLSRIFSEQAVVGQDYDELKPVIGINLLDFKLFEELPNWHNTANFTVKGIEKPITDCITMHFLELPKLKFSDVKKAKRLEAWGAYFSGVYDEKELEVLCMNEPLLKEAISYEQAFTNNDEMYRKYQQREDAIREETTKIRLGEKRGIIIGRKEGITIGKKQGEKEKAETMARKMLADNVDLKIIAKYTELPLEEIIKLSKA